MGRTRRQLLAELTSRDLSEWAAFERVYGPIGPERGDIQAALVASVIANVNRDPKQKKDPFTVQDFIPNYSGQVKWQDPDEMAQAAKAAAVMIGEEEL